MLSRPRRNRQSSAIRALVRERELTPGHLVQPIFLLPDPHARLPVVSLPGTFRLGIEEVVQEVAGCLALGIRSFIMFPAVPEQHKDKTGSYATSPDNFYLHAATRLKTEFPEICLISDVALDPYSTDGHDGLVLNGRIDNDQTLPLIGAMAVAQARAGFDVIGPSEMMDGRVASIRRALDAEGFTDTAIMSYTAKYASAFYGPFRDALDSAPRQLEGVPTDKKTYQMDPANRREALREAALDAAEGADYLMVKPAINYLDIIRELHDAHTLPIAAYHVSGECAMLLAAAERGWLDYRRAASEALLSIRRAGASVIISYFAKDFAGWYHE
ncbi:porphobilinogen synthase [Neolewinella lacunae]|uniref:Delta-aminolevulinic acid dehydratase n=1 Tax=Neolewinella lacunae TaxID=1517758 RepID=A0A923PMW5_9BACT|nr:porphobilinogen synthase [Neolewinella lacunae]MBC6995646.1 porphobilinogen synthase [Neolewinella lacunae]MDN3634287.1 porphobilinogen synthase [Neolewinella lacunae]